MALVRNPFVVIGAVAALPVLWAWLCMSGTIVVLDRGGVIARVDEVSWSGPRPLHRLPFGLWIGLPHGDGTVRLICRNGTEREHGYVTSATHVWLRVAESGRCGQVEPI